MDIDPIKRSLDEIEQELESALANLNASNQRVDDLLMEYGSGDIAVRRMADIGPESEPAKAPDDQDEPPPEY